MIGVELADKATAEAVQQRCLDDGVIVLTCGPDGNVLRLIPPLTMTDDELDHGLAVLGQGADRASREAREGLLVDLAGADLGELVEDHDGLRRLEGGQPLADPRDQLVLGRPRRPGTRLTNARGHLAPALVGDADHGGLAHGGVELERLLHLHRRDVLAAGHDEVLGAVDDGEVAVGVDHGEVAGAQPAAAQHLVGRLGRVEVADHHVVAAGADLADGLPVPRHLDVVGVEHPHVGAEDRDAGGRALGRGWTARPGFGRLRVRVGELSVMP